LEHVTMGAVHGWGVQKVVWWWWWWCDGKAGKGRKAAREEGVPAGAQKWADDSMPFQVPWQGEQMGAATVVGGGLRTIASGTGRCGGGVCGMGCVGVCGWGVMS